MKYHVRLFVVISTLLAASFTARADSFVLTVDIYSGFDSTNSPTAQPYTGFAGRYYLPATNVINFGNPFGLSQFAAVVSFDEYVSTTGFYIAGLDSNNGVTANPIWSAELPVPSIFGAPYAIGSCYNEILLTEGINHFEIDFLAMGAFTDGKFGTVGGGPYTLKIAYPTPWGGDPRVWDAVTYLIPVQVPETPEPMADAIILCAAALVFAAIRRMKGLV